MIRINNAQNKQNQGQQKRNWCGYYFVADDDVEHKEAEQAMQYKATQQPWITNRRGGSLEWG